MSLAVLPEVDSSLGSRLSNASSVVSIVRCPTGEKEGGAVVDEEGRLDDDGGAKDSAAAVVPADAEGDNGPKENVGCRLTLEC